MTATEPPTGAERWLDPEWLTTALAPHLGGATVRSVDGRPVGTGQMASCVRLTLDVDGPTDLPATLVAKLPATDPTSRATAAAMRNYLIEVSFYRELLPTLKVRAPHCVYAEIDPVTDDFVLLLEDVTPAEQGDQILGCSVDDAAVAVNELPNLHAPRWGDPTLASLEWLHRNNDSAIDMTGMLIAGLFPGFLDRYASRLDDDLVAISQQLVAGLPTYMRDRPGPWTVAHGDYRLDNLLFKRGEGAPAVAVVDWQTVAHGPGVSDLSYFIGGGLTVEDRRANEEALVHSYHDRMRAAGVDLGWDELWESYRRFTFAGLIMAIAASMLVVQTPRGDDMFMAMAERAGRHALDLDATEFLTD